MSRTGIDIVVVNRQTPDDLRECLGSIVKHPPTRSHTVTVVNVEPEDADLWAALEFCVSRHGWKTFAFETNVGFNRACNQAGAEGVNDIVALLNADTVWTPGAFDGMCETLEEHEDWAIAGPRQVDGHGSITAGGIFGTHAAPKHRGWKQPGAGSAHTDIRSDCTSVSGSALFIKRRVWNALSCVPEYRAIFPHEIGPMGDMAHYFGDQLLCYAAHAQGYRCGFVGTVTIIHKWHRASAVGGFGEQHLREDRIKFNAYCDAIGVGHE